MLLFIFSAFDFVFFLDRFVETVVGSISTFSQTDSTKASSSRSKLISFSFKVYYKWIGPYKPKGIPIKNHIASKTNQHKKNITENGNIKEIRVPTP